MNEKEKAMCALQRLSFALVESSLFLDSHPTDKSALEYYGKMKKEYTDALEMYTANYGPVTLLGADCEKGWEWVEAPWPWESEVKG